MDQITAAVTAAQEQSKNLPSASPAPSATAVAIPAKRTTAAAFLNNARVNVDIFLKIEKDGGMRFAPSKARVTEFEGVLDCSRLAFPQQVVYGDPPIYAKTYDGGANVQNSPYSWQTHLERAKAWRNTAQTNPFDTADIAIKLTKEVIGYDLTGPKPVEVVVGKVGQVVGYTPSFMGVGTIHSLLKAIAEAGGDVEKAQAAVKVTAEGKTNAKGQAYGVIQVTFISLVQ